MNSEQRKAREKAIAVIARNFPQVSNPTGLQDDLYKLGLKAQRNAEKLCNVTDHVDQREKLRAALGKIEEKHGITLNAEIGGDPRGFCLKVIMPEGDYNSWGGRESGWGW